MSLFTAVRYSQHYYRTSEKSKVQSLARSGGIFGRKVDISEETLNELK